MTFLKNGIRLVSFLSIGRASFFSRYVKFKSSISLDQPYRFFGEIFESMDQLTETLRRDKRNREKIQATREEWIAGLSHDLKTPLSSIYGYSMMLESKQYDWSPEEVKEMGQVVREKSEYQLIH